MQFFETVYGRRFFEGQLPTLIDSVNRLAAAIEKSNEIKEKDSLASQEVKDDVGGNEK